MTSPATLYVTPTPVESPESLSSSGNFTSMSFSKKLLDKAKVSQAAYDKLREPSFGVTPAGPAQPQEVTQMLEPLPGSSASEAVNSVHTSLQSVVIRCDSRSEDESGSMCNVHMVEETAPHLVKTR